MKTRSIKVADEETPCIAVIMSREEALIVVGAFGNSNGAGSMEGARNLLSNIGQPMTLTREKTNSVNGTLYESLRTAIADTY